MHPNHPNAHSYSPEDCRVLTDILGRVGDRWTILLLLVLEPGAMRFGEIRRQLTGISQRMLTLSLRGLERDGVVLRTPHSAKPQAVDYALTARGHSLVPTLTTLAHWAVEHRQAIEQSRAAFDTLQAAGPPPASLPTIPLPTTPEAGIWARL